MPLREGDLLATGEAGQATVLFPGRNMVTLSAKSSVRLRRGPQAGSDFGVALVAGSARILSEGHGVRLTVAGAFGALEVGAGAGAAHARPVIVEIAADGGVHVLMGDIEVQRTDGTKEQLHGDPNAALRVADLMPVPGMPVSAAAAAAHPTMNSLNVAELVARPVAARELGGTFSAAPALAPPLAPPLAPVLAPVLAPTLTLALPEEPLEPVACVLFTNNKQTVTRPTSTGPWRPAATRVVLTPGTFVWARKGDAWLECGARSAINLRGDTQIQLTHAGTARARDEVGYVILSGAVQASLTRLNAKDDTVVRHVIEALGQHVTVTPSRREAYADVSVGKASATLTLRRGHGILDGGLRVEAGATVDWGAGGQPSAPRFLDVGRVDVHARSNAIVYCGGSVPPLNFVWTGEVPGPPWIFEMAQDNDMVELVIAEELARSNFVIDALAAGKYFWRVTSGKEVARGVLQIVDEGDNDCDDCQPIHVISDTGKPATVSFQHALPAITLRWQETPGASAYHLQVIAAGATAPRIDEHLKALSRVFPAGLLPAGAYTWTVTSDGVDRAVPRRNALQLTHDNAMAAAVRVQVPPPGGQTVSGDSIIASGDADVGARISVNGKQVDVDGKGRFKEPVALHPGVNPLTFRTLGADGVERYYLRDVTRK